MRRILVLVMVAGLAIGAAEVASGAVPVLLRTPGAQLLELRAGQGRAVVTRRGSLLVNLGPGKLRIVDLRGGGRPHLNEPCRNRAEWVSTTTVEIRGSRIRCFIWSGQDGGPWQVIMRGRRISASGSVRGSLTLDAVDEGATGRFRIADGAWQRWPRRAHTYVLHRK